VEVNSFTDQTSPHSVPRSTLHLPGSRYVEFSVPTLALGAAYVDNWTSCYVFACQSADALATHLSVRDESLLASAVVALSEIFVANFVSTYTAHQKFP